MSTITVRLNSEEKRIFNEYATLLGIPLSTLFKNALEEKLEDEFDIKSILAYEEKVINDSIKTYDHNEVRNILGL